MNQNSGTLPPFLLLERAGDGHFVKPALAAAERDVVHGVDLMAWAMMAAEQEGLGEQVIKTAHGIFSRPTARTAPIDLHVEHFHRGRAFGADTITVTQQGKNSARIQLLSSAGEPDLIKHSPKMPVVPGPDDSDAFLDAALGIPGIELRSATPFDYISSDHPVLPSETFVWIRAEAPVDSPIANQAMLCASTGTMLIGTAMLPHQGIGQDQAHRTISTGVVSHTATFHEPFALSDWLLLAQEGTYAGGGRVHGRGLVFDQSGALVASFVQDAIIRHFNDGRDHSAEAATVM